MSAVGAITSVGRASWGDNGRPCWRVYFNLDDPHALGETGPTQRYPSWCFELPRDPDPSPTHWAVAPVTVGQRVEVSAHGGRGVTIAGVAFKTLAGVYDYNAAY